MIRLADLTTNLRRAALLLAIVAGFCVTSLHAVTFEAYKAKIDSARHAALTLEMSYRDETVTDSMKKDFAAQIRRDFPQSERIEWQGGTVETANDWLLDKTKALETETNSKNGLLAAVELREYLTSIVYKLNELEQATAGEQTKDRDKQKLAEILRREEYQKPQAKEESAVQQWIRAFLEWLESLFPKSSGEPLNLSGLSIIGVLLQVVLWGALLALLGFLIYKIAPLVFPNLRRTRSEKKKKRVILGEQLDENETAVDLFGEAERLAREGNLRGAIRKGYIALLCDLSDRKVIGLAQNKTNRDYLRDVRSRRELYPKMRSVTDMFERHWYGAYESAESDWAQFRDEYDRAIRSV